jgi:transposase
LHDSQSDSIEKIKQKFLDISFCLNERSRRLWAATEAKSYGWGGTSIVSKATGIAPKTIRKGLSELASSERLASNRIRKPGGGRKKLKDKHPTLEQDLDFLISPVTRGDPESPLLWTCKSTDKLADELRQRGYSISQRTMCRLLSELDYSLQANKKTEEGSNHPDRNAQFEHINKHVISYRKDQCPVISVDTKKKENIGNFKNKGKEYQPKGKPIEVNTHDFPDKKLGKVSPYGVYDISQNKGWVSVGISCDTAEFAVNTIRSWWYKMGQPLYETSDKMLITADCGGSNGYRTRLWKRELQKLANELNITIHVCHFPPGTSKWNKIEHKMFSYISMNWRGKPLITRETVVNLIGNTKTKKGLEIQAQLDENIYEKGIKISDKEMENINIEKEDFHGEWNYKILPQINII